MTQTFPSKIDTWLLVVLVLSLLPAGAGVVAAIHNATVGERAITVIGAVVGLGLPVWVMAATRYTVSPDTLLVRSGPFRWRIPTASIVEVRATNNPLSSPALSLDRLDVVTDKGRHIRLSPDDKRGFCAALSEANPKIQVHLDEADHA